MSFWSGFSATIGVIAAIVVLVLLLKTIAKTRVKKQAAPLMRIYKGDKLIKERFAPVCEKFRKYLENLKEGESMELISRHPLYEHPINSFFGDYRYPLNKKGTLPMLVGFRYPRTDSLYFTICDTYTEYTCVSLKFSIYFESGRGVTQEEYEHLKAKDWWLVKKHRDMHTLYMIGTLEKTTLPPPVTKP